MALVNSASTGVNASGTANVMSVFNVFTALTMGGDGDSGSSSGEVATPTADQDSATEGARSAVDAIYAAGTYGARNALDLWWVDNTPVFADGNQTTNAGDSHDPLFADFTARPADAGAVLQSFGPGDTGTERLGSTDYGKFPVAAGQIGIAQGAAEQVLGQAGVARVFAELGQNVALDSMQTWLRPGPAGGGGKLDS